jgi:hypothetical protein
MTEQRRLAAIADEVAMTAIGPKLTCQPRLTYDR